MGRGRAGLTWDGNPTVKPPFGTARIDWAHPLARGLVGCWLFNEGGGVTARDLAGVKHGTLTNGPTWNVGRVGRGLSFDGVDDYVSTPNILNPANTNSSATTWVKAESFAHLDVNADAAHILQQEDGVGTGRTWLSVARLSSSDFRLRSYLGGAATTGTVNWNTLVGVWKHVAITYDGATVRLYIDAVEDGSSAKTAESSTGGMRIGAHKAPSTVNEEFDGLIDDAHMYNGALSALEVMHSYAEPYAFLQPVIRRRYFVAVGVRTSSIDAWVMHNRRLRKKYQRC